jgi:hypothetical protein
VLLGKELYSYK